MSANKAAPVRTSFANTSTRASGVGDSSRNGGLFFGVLTLFFSADVDIRLTCDKFLLREHDFFVESLHPKEVSVCTPFKLEQKTREFAGNHCQGPRGCHCSDSNGLD